MYRSLTKLAINTVITPVAVVADVLTVGGALTDKEQTYTEDQIEKIEDAIDDLLDGE